VTGTQNTVGGTLTSSQPASADLPAGGALFFDYALPQTSQVSIQAISAKVQPILTILRNGEVIATQPNTSGALTVTLEALLTNATYQVRVEGANGTSGSVILLVQSETPVGMMTIGLDTLVSETLDVQVPLAFYQFGNLPEPAYLYIDSELPEGKLLAVLKDGDNDAIIGSFSSPMTGIRFTLPAGGRIYVVQLTPEAGSPSVPFTLCLTAVRTHGCEFNGGFNNPTTPTSTDIPPFSDPITETPICTVSPTSANGVNIRQSASTGSIVIGALPGNQSADVLGISPDKNFFNIQYNTTNGWVAQSVVTSEGQCDTLDTVQPPPIIAPSNTPTATPIPATSTPSGPCLVIINSPTNVYTTTSNHSEHLFDQIQSGTISVIGRTHDNSWWKLNYSNSWIQTNTFGHSVSTTGACHNLPVVSP